MVAARLKQIYKKSVLPCEQRYRYEYFYESPLLSDVEFDGAFIRERNVTVGRGTSLIGIA
jgi:hypothetical protein